MFSAMILLVTVLGHLYAYKRLVWNARLPRTAHVASVVVLLALSATILVGRRSRHLTAEWAAPIAQLGWSWFGVLSYLLMMLVIAAVLEGGLALSRWMRSLKERRAAKLAGASAVAPSAPVSEERRLFLARAFATGTVAATAGLSSYGIWRAYTPTRVQEVVVRLPLLPRALDGYTIVQLTDVHVGPLIRRRFLDEVVAHCNSLKPDAVVLTGDLVDGSPSALAHSVAAFSKLRSRAGTFMVTGNHEYYSGDVRWVHAFEGLGVEVLRNRRLTLGDTHPGGASFDLIGVDDWGARHRYGNGRGYDLERAIAGRDPDRASVLLAHQPANFEVVKENGIGLQLSGHTHGGQMFPMTLVVSQVWKHSAGLYEEDGAFIYVSRGTGFWGPPMRVGSPPEITKIVLTT